MNRLPVLIALALASPAFAALEIFHPADAPANVKLAAREIRRYIYLRTGALPAIQEDRSSESHGTYIHLLINPALAPQEFHLKTQGNTLSITGGSDVGVLYGAYRYAEQLGVRFSMDGDVIPDERLKELPVVKEETGKPLFELRGLLPFHDFPEGPDWWTADDWKSILGQATKMRMNFVGLHTYPFHNTDLGPEPLVWVGVPEDVNADGTVKISDHASWYTTAKHQPYGCYAPMKTGDYSFGGALVFPTDDYGPEVNTPADFPMPKTPEAKAAMINRVGAMMKDVFTDARRRGMKIAVGTEAPLDIPDTAKARLKELGLDEKSPAALKTLYTGMFTRIQRAYPIDYYWIWGHEGEIDQKRFVANMEAAQAALQELKKPFALGISGWGWITGNFPALDKVLAKDIVFSAISMSVGAAPVSGNFGRLQDRPKWAIPWFEDDPVLASIQLRAGRMRRDAVDALQHGCTGLMGLHWRTRILSPNISALAQAGWEQGGWSRPASAKGGKRDVQVVGGQTAAFLNNNLPAVYQTLRFNLLGYRFALPNGEYTVTLRFCEPAYKEAGKRVFGVKLQGKQVVEHLDILAVAGPLAVLDKTFGNIAVTQGELRIDFTPEVEFPSICAIEVTGQGVTRKINCGGPEHQDYAADPSAEALPRDLPTGDFYDDWATAQFGGEVGTAAAAIFTQLDGNFPAPSAWIRGPGAIAVNKQPWGAVAPRYAFVERFASLRPRVRGEGNLERFDWWLNTFRVTRFMGELGCARGELDAILGRMAGEKKLETRRQLARTQALPVRLRMVTLLGGLHNALLATLHNATELGTLCNIEQQSMQRLKILTGQDAALEKHLGEPLPAAAQPWKDYRGAPRLVNMTARTAANKGEVLKLRIIALDPQTPMDVAVHVRPMGRGEWQVIPATHIARAVHEANLPAAQEDFEYYITAGKLVWPATAPGMCQTVVVAPVNDDGNTNGELP